MRSSGRGVIVTLVVSGLAVRETRARPRVAYVAVLAGSSAYAVAAGWHFIEHANGSDPAAADVALAILWAALLAGAAFTAIASWPKRMSASAK